MTVQREENSPSPSNFDISRFESTLKGLVIAEDAGGIFSLVQTVPIDVLCELVLDPLGALSMMEYCSFDNNWIQMLLKLAIDDLHPLVDTLESEFPIKKESIKASADEVVAEPIESDPCKAVVLSEAESSSQRIAALTRILMAKKVPSNQLKWKLTARLTTILPESDDADEVLISQIIEVGDVLKYHC